MLVLIPQIMRLWTNTIVQFIMGALYAGQLNSGVNAAWILVYLAYYPEWKKACYEEACRVADSHSTLPSSAPLAERLAYLCPQRKRIVRPYGLAIRPSR